MVPNELCKPIINVQKWVIGITNLCCPVRSAGRLHVNWGLGKAWNILRVPSVKLAKRKRYKLLPSKSV